jgi:vacuolar protein sorting-associated protein 54
MCVSHSFFSFLFLNFFKSPQVSSQRQVALTRLCTGLATVSTPLRNIQENGSDDQTSKDKKPVAVVEGTHYKVVWSCLLLVEMIMTYLSSAAYFQQSLATNAVTKVVESMRLFNARATNLVLGAGAIHSAAKLKSINAKHLSYVTQCLGMTMSLLPHIRAALMAQLPPKQHTLLTNLDDIKSEYKDHNEKVLNKFVSIIGGIVEHGLAPRIASIDFDERAKNEIAEDSHEDVQCFVFLDGISSSTRKLHHVLNALLPPDHLQDVFSRIFAHLDQQVPALFVAAASTAAFSFPSTDAGKYRLLLEVGYTTKVLNGLAGVLPWDFTAINVLERKMDYKFPELAVKNETSTEEPDPKVQAGKEKPSNEAADPTVQVGKEEPSNEVADPTVQAGKEEPSNEVAAPTIQAEKEEPSNEVADPKDEDVVVNVNEANSLDYVQERDTSSDNALNGNKEPLKSNGCENAESDVDTQATAVVNLKSPSSSSENDKSIPEKNNGNESLVNNAEP